MQLPNATEGPPAGWHSDPLTGGTYQRYWDGQAWTDYTYPLDGPPLPPSLGERDDSALPSPEGVDGPDPVAAALAKADPPPTGEPGFYLDPVTDGAYERWWDGHGWLDATHPEGGPTVGRSVTRDPLPGEGDETQSRSGDTHGALWIAAAGAAMWTLVGLTGWGVVPGEITGTIVADGLINPVTWAMVVAAFIASHRSGHSTPWTWVITTTMAALPCLAYATRLI